MYDQIKNPFPDKEYIINTSTNPTNSWLRQGYFLNKNMELVTSKDGLYDFKKDDVNITFDSNVNKLIIAIQTQVVFIGKIYEEKEFEVLLKQLGVKL